MSKFSYKAKSTPTDIRTGVIEAQSQDEVVQKILSQGLVPIDVSEYKPPVEKQVSKRAAKSLLPSFKKKISLKVLSQLSRQLYDLVDAGVPILRALEILGRSFPNPAVKDVLGTMHVHLQGGESLSNAMAKYPDVFPAYYVHMVRSGEASGHLPEILSRLAESTQKDFVMRSKVSGSLMYPGIVFCVGVLTFFVLLAFVMPRLTSLFEDFDTALPLPTQIIMNLSQFMASFWWLILLVFGGVGIMMAQYAASTKGRRKIDQLILKIPVLNDFIQQAEMTRIARTLATLLQGGVPMAIALESVVDTANNVAIKEELVGVARDVRSGDSFSKALRKMEKFWSESSISMVAVGEESGKLEKALHKLSVALEWETNEKAEIFTTLLGPLVLLLVVGAIGAMIVSMLLPLFQMNAIMK